MRSRFISLFVAVLAIAWGASGAVAGGTLDAAGSIPIELADAPAISPADDLVGGWHGVVFLFFFLVFVAAVVAISLEATHRHFFFHDCEHCYHHHYPPPPPPPPPPPS